MYLGLQVTCSIFLPNFNQIWIFLPDCHKVPNMKFQTNPSSGSHADACGEVDEQTWKTKMVLFAVTHIA
jgi:hypothetical protein